MVISTTVARHYAIRMIVIGALCVAFAGWGAYDLWVKIPRQEQVASDFENLEKLRRALETKRQEGKPLTPDEEMAAAVLDEQVRQLSPQGQAPGRPAKFDRLVCWLFILCLPMAPYFFGLYLAARRRVHRLDEEGNLHLPGETWARDDVVDIDMSRWMARSTAQAVHRDGRRAKLDDYIHHDMHLIVGAIASRLYPEQWDDRGRSVPADATDPAVREPDS